MDSKNVHAPDYRESWQELPYTPPYLMIDRAWRADDGASVRMRGLKNVSITEPFFTGHFPDHPVVPGVLQLEALFQLGVLGVCAGRSAGAALPTLQGIKRFRFRRPVVPGDQLRIEAVLTPAGPDVWTIDGAVTCDQEPCCDGQLTLRFLADTELVPTGLPWSQSSAWIEHADRGELIDISRIQATIPHRFPFLFVDRIAALPTGDDGRDAVIGLKNVTRGESHFLSRYGEQALVVNSLLMEVLAQVGCVHMLLQPENHRKLIYFMAIDQAQFHRPVMAGDQLVVKATTVASRERFGKASGEIFVADELVGEGEFKFALRNS